MTLLADQGRAALPIRLPEDPCPTLVTAARELAHYLGRMAGATFEIACGGAGPGIRLAVDPALGREAYTLRTGPQGLDICGGSPRGALYGAYGLLEKLGVGFYTQDVTVAPRRPRLQTDDLDLSDGPAMEFRQIDGPLHMSPAWRARNRINAFRDQTGGMGTPGVVVPPMDRWGGQESYALFVHTFDTLVPAAQYFDSHPEYYALREGERRPDQLCLSHPEVLNIAIASVREQLRAHPEATIISVSQNDSLAPNPCACPACAAVDAEEGSHAGSLIRFVNAVAQAIEDEFPHVLVDTLAYRHTRRPPRLTRPRENVCVRLCSIECCFGHPLEACDQVTGPFARWRREGDATFQQDLAGWGAICERVYVWDYVTNFVHYWLPFPNLHVLGPNMRFFARHSVKGVYAEGNYHSPSPDLMELRNWLLAKLMWNPDFDVSAGVVSFTDAVYGPAAPDIRAYIALLERRVTQGNLHFGIYEPADAPYLDPDTLGAARKIIARAQARDLSLTERLYVEKVALSLEFAAVGQQMLAGITDPGRIDAMMDRARALGLTAVSEVMGSDEAYDQMLGRPTGQRNIYRARPQA